MKLSLEQWFVVRAAIGKHKSHASARQAREYFLKVIEESGLLDKQRAVDIIDSFAEDIGFFDGEIRLSKRIKAAYHKLNNQLGYERYAGDDDDD